MKSETQFPLIGTEIRMKITRTATALTMLVSLTACGDNAPGKDEVRDFMAMQSISEVYSVNPFQKHS
ncbi:hypothetical protein A0U92_07260 [Acetobacter aceti]|uniref:Uncharacterized protein n=1 Tax=Acetobacter aceti TaxID=435 RepID=A0A1U9KFN2_ACEAC|nr:hypothetical protein A0U92_07260 [Acetobacter aceti]